MMTKICTDVEQSNKLIELGIDVNTADMCYHFIEINKTPICIRWEKVHDDEKDNSIPAWSLSALMKLMPDKISIDNESYYLSFTKKSVEFRGPITWDGQKTKSFEMDNILDAVFEMVVWLKENGKL